MGAQAAAPKTEMTPLSGFLGHTAKALVAYPKIDDSPEAILLGCDKVSRAITSIQAKVILEAENSGVVGRSGARNTAAWIESITGESRRGAYIKSRVAEAIKDIPALGEALNDGTVNAEQAAMIHETAANTKAEPELLAELIQDAKGESVKETGRLARQLERKINRESPEERFAQQRRKRGLSIRLKTDGSGMLEIHGELDPIAGERVRLALSATAKSLHEGESEKRTYRQILADALETRCVGTITDARTARRTPGNRLGSTSGSTGSGVDVVVTVTLQDLQIGLGRTGKIAGSGEQIPVEQIRRMACENGIIPAVLGGAGEVLDMGRKVRLANRAQRRALKIKYGGCGIPGCDASFDFCQIHHIREWLKGGLTDLANLIPLCNRHHHLVHEDKWEIGRDQNGSITFEPPLSAPQQGLPP